MGGGKAFIISDEKIEEGFLVYELTDYGWNALPGFYGDSICVFQGFDLVIPAMMNKSCQAANYMDGQWNVNPYTMDL
jgi:hypothetical protein